MKKEIEYRGYNISLYVNLNVSNSTFNNEVIARIDNCYIKTHHASDSSLTYDIEVAEKLAKKYIDNIFEPETPILEKLKELGFN